MRWRPIPAPIPIRGLGLDEVDGPRMCLSTTLALQMVIELFFARIAEFLWYTWLGRSNEGTAFGKVKRDCLRECLLG